MFRIELFCDDKNLPRLLRGFTGLVIGQPAVQPVANAEVRNGKVKAKINGNLAELFLEFVKENKLAEITADHMRQFSIAHGYKPSGYSGFLKRLLNEKVLRKKPRTMGKHTVYLLVK